jgi:trigger factor
MRNEFLEELLKLVEVELPEILVHEELHKMIHEFEGQVQSMGTTSENYLKKMGKTVDDLEKEWEPQAEKRVKIFLILDEVAKQAEVQVANEKIEEEMNKTLNYYKKVKDGEKNIDMARLYNYVKETLTHQEVFNVLEKL